MNNKGIDSQVEQYLDSAEPNYALLLRGKWGIGKSFYWNRFVNNSSHKDKNNITFSVAGLAQLEELERALFLASIKNLGSDLLKETGTVIGRALLRWVKVDPKDLTMKADVSSGKTVICIDDIERFAGDFEVLFGFILSLLDEAALHVILIADEEKAIKKFACYAEYKERIIGRSLDVPLALQQFYDYVAKGYSHQQTRRALLDAGAEAIALFTDKGIRNLRTVRAILDQINVLLSSVEWREGKESSIQNLLSAVTFSKMALAESAANGDLVQRIFRQPDLGIALALRGKASLRPGPRAEGSEEDGLRELIESLGFGSEAFAWPSSPSFAAYMTGGTPRSEEIAGDFKVFGEPEKEEPSLLFRFRGYRTMAENDFRKLFEDLQQAISSRSFGAIQDLWTAFDISYHLAQTRISGETPNECRDRFLDVVRRYPLEKLQNASLEVWPEQRDANQLSVLEAIRSLEQQVRTREREEYSRRLRESLIGGADVDPVDSLLSPFGGCDPFEIYTRLTKNGRQAVIAIRKFYGGRKRILGSPEMPAEKSFAAGLAQIIEDNMPDTNCLTLDQAAMSELGGVLREYARNPSGEGGAGGDLAA